MGAPDRGTSPARLRFNTQLASSSVGIMVELENRIARLEMQVEQLLIHLKRIDHTPRKLLQCGHSCSSCWRSWRS
jgi:hypothetical protein